ncbi:L-arabinose isomerase [Planctomycetota bacterium]|nr:L-arabinose isomerase [Planctomycetota bacterium]
MIDFSNHEIWFITGSQHLYGDDVLKQVSINSQQIASYLNSETDIPIKIVTKPVLTDPAAIDSLCTSANQTKNCIGLITWMHTFSPSKMWISGLKKLIKPFAHLHTQFNQEIPWQTIDMDYMNLHQSAHGGREFGHICARLKINRKVIVGHWKNPETHKDLDTWMRSVAAWHDSQNMKIARIGDNMREVAVTEGDKVQAQQDLGYSVNGYGVGDLVQHIQSATDKQIINLCNEYAELYTLADSLKVNAVQHQSLRDAAAIELGLRSFLTEGNFQAFTNTFENLHGMKQLPGIATQRLMSDGYGFGAEGDWKHAALVRTMKVMAHNLQGGTSFMEDYTYHFAPDKASVLGAHMLEICPSIANDKPSCEIHPLGIGGKEDPVRLVFNSTTGPAINASIIDLGGRFRMLVNDVTSIEPSHDLPKLPVARVLWDPQPNLKQSATAWIYAGGAHHTCLSFALNKEHLIDFAQIANLELLMIDKSTTIEDFNNQIRWNDLAYSLSIK